MKLNSISNQNFGILWISDNYRGAIKKEIERRKFESFIEKVDKIKNSQDYHIFVENNGDVYYRTDKRHNADDYRDNLHFAGEDLSPVEKFCYAVNKIFNYDEEQTRKKLENKIIQLEDRYERLKHYASWKERYPNAF